MLRHLRAVLAWVGVMSGAPLMAHDLWIEPSTFSPTLGELVGLRLRVGQDLLGDPLPYDAARVNRFFVQDAVERKPVLGRRGADPAGVMRVTTPGLLIVGYHSKPSAVELAADKFNAYLTEEGLDTISALRTGRGETGASARELFARCAKSLLLAGSLRPAQLDRPLGLPLELVAEGSPHTLRRDQDLPIRLTFEGEPLAGALVVAINRLSPGEKQSARTDSNGRVRFRMHSGGMWLVKAVHMIPAPAGVDAEWESFWASLTFELRATNEAGD